MSGAVSWLRRREGSRLAVLGLVLAAILFIAVNVIAGITLKGAQLDLSEGRLYTLAEGTRRTLAALDQPIDLRLYFSRTLGEVSPPYAAYHTRVGELLDRYVDLAGGRLRVERLDPEPFSDAEDRAVADGLQGVPLTQAGDLGYFGIAGVNATDGREAIPFLNLDRERFIEYDLTKLIHGLAKPDKPVLGLLSALPPERDQSGMPTRPPQLALMQQLGEFFRIETLAADAETIGTDVDALLVLNLGGLALPALKAIDRFVHGGGPAFVLVDPVLEAMPGHGAIAAEPADPAEVTRLLAAWGLTLVADRVAGDLDAARRVATGHGGVAGDYVAWLSLTGANFDADDPTMASIERLHFATAGILEPLDGRTTTVRPLIATGPRAAPIEASQVRFTPDVPGLLAAFRSGGKPLMLAARVTGPAAAAFAGDTGGTGPVNLIVVADADFVYDPFWVNRGTFFGEQVMVPIANNADFVANALENLSGSQSLAGLRGRGTSYRPFTLVEQLRRDAELAYRAKEVALQNQLKDLQRKLEAIQKERGAEGEVIIGTEDQQAIERFRGEILAVRKQLRDVQLALRQDIERLEGLVKLVNIALVPVTLAVVGLILVAVRRLRQRRAAARPA